MVTSKSNWRLRRIFWKLIRPNVNVTVAALVKWRIQAIKDGGYWGKVGAMRMGVFSLWFPSWSWDSMTHCPILWISYSIDASGSPPVIFSSSVLALSLSVASVADTTTGLTTGYPGGGKAPWFVAFAEFCRLNTATMADIMLSVWHHWIWSWEDMLTIDSPEPVHTGSITSLSTWLQDRSYYSGKYGEF